MKNKNYIPLVLVLLILANACNKKEDDPVTQQTISGMVYNQCTDSGLANVQVFLKINKDNSPVQSIETVSGTNGTFSFANIAIHSNSKYTYALYIPSKSGINGGGGTEVGFNGTTLSFNYDEANILFKPRVTPKYLFLCFNLPSGVSISYPDSIQLYYYQRKFHNNVPSLPWNGTIGNIAFNSGDCGANYPMGLWNFTIDKWKSGVHTTTQDSIYLEWGATKTYTVNW